MEWLVEWLEGIANGFIGWIGAVASGFIQWLVSLVMWSISFLQDSWPAMADTFNIIVQNPAPLAIGMAGGIVVILLGWVLACAFFRAIDRRSSENREDEADNDADDESEEQPVAVGMFYLDDPQG